MVQWLKMFKSSFNSKSWTSAFSLAIPCKSSILLEIAIQYRAQYIIGIGLNTIFLPKGCQSSHDNGSANPRTGLRLDPS